MGSHVYVDNSNVYIEGSRLSAVSHKMAGASSIYDAMQNDVTDTTWNLDYGELYAIICGDIDIVSANLWGSPPPGDSFWEMVESKGFKPTVFDRSFGKEKKVDVAIAHAITKDVYSGKVKKGDEIVLLSGDKDFCPVIDDVKAAGYKVVVAFWNHASNDIKKSASIFFDLNPHFGDLTK